MSIAVAIIELPAEGRFKVKVDEQETGSFIGRLPDKDGLWGVWSTHSDGHERQSKITPHSREGAAMLAAYLHFEHERRSIENAREAEGDADS